MQTKFFTWLLVFVLVGLSSAYIYQANKDKENYLYKDYGKFYQAARFALEGKDPYDKIFIIHKVDKKIEKSGQTPRIDSLGGLLNPPFFVLLVLPFGLLSYSWSLLLWSLVSIVCGIISLGLLQKCLPVHFTLNLSLSLLIAFFAYYPTFANIQFGQVTLILMPFEIGAWLAVRRNNNRLAGVLLGIAASLKPFFGLFLLYFLIRREWRALSWFISTIVICAGIAMIGLGVKSYVNYYAILHSVKWYSSSWNASLYGFLVRLLGGSERNIPLIAAPGLSLKVFYLSVIIILAGFIKFLWPTSKIISEKKRDLDFSITVITLLIISPLTWLYYLPLLIIPWVVLLQLAREKQHIGIYLSTCLSIVLSGISHVFIGPGSIRAENVVAVFIVSALSVIALFILFVTLFFARRISQHPGRPVGSLVLDPIEWISVYGLLLFPSLLSILNTVNSTALFGESFIPDFTSAFFGS